MYGTISIIKIDSIKIFLTFYIQFFMKGGEAWACLSEFLIVVYPFLPVNQKNVQSWRILHL